MTRKLVVFAVAGVLSWCGLVAGPESGDLERFRQQYERLSRDYDPITLTSSERLHGWMSGDGILAFLLMHEATGQERYLREFTHHADRLLKLRDVDRGLQNHRGERLPAWRSEDAYLLAQAILKSSLRESALSFLTPAIFRWSEQSAGGVLGRLLLKVKHIDQTRFSMVLTVNAGAPQEKIHTWENLTMDRNASGGEQGDFAPERFEADETLDWRRQINLFDLQAPGTPEERIPAEGEFPLTEGRYTRITNKGTLNFQLAYFARMVLQSDFLRENPHFRERAARYVEATQQAVAVHDDQWRDNGSGEGWFIARKFVPQWSAGVDLPINQYNVLGLTMIERARLTRDRHYRDRVTKLARAFKKDMEHVAEDDAYLWFYSLKRGKVGPRRAARERESR